MLEVNSRRSPVFRRLQQLMQRKGRAEACRFFAEGDAFLQMRPRTVFVRRGRWEGSSGAQLRELWARACGGAEAGPWAGLDTRPLAWGSAVLDDFGLAGEPPGLAVLSNELYDAVSSQEQPQGVLCVFAIPAWSAGSTPGAAAGSAVVVLDGVQQPNNLGVILRTMEAFGALSLVLMRGNVDLYNDKVVRGSMGAVVRGNVRVWEGTDAPELRRLLEGHRVFACTSVPAGQEGRCLDAAGLAAQLSGKDAVIFGSEARGVSPELLALADARVRIPMVPGVDSLNVGVTVGIILHAVAAARNVGS